MNEHFALYCSQPPGCVCRNCLYHASGRCPHGHCYDDLRSRENPYDKAHPGDPPRAFWSNWKDDQAHWCRGGTFYQTHECPDFVEYENSKHIVKECLEAVVEVYQDGYIRCSLVEEVGCEECMKRFNEREERKEADEVPKQKYWTKCGRQFEKNSTASVTGYELLFEEDLSFIDGITQELAESFEKCVSCPFRKQVTEWNSNGPDKHVRWECRAGSREPNQTNSYTGSIDDKNNIHIKSLHIEFLELVIKYVKEDPDISCQYTQDEDDGRRCISVSCSQNKKGIAAKKALVDKLFGEQAAAPKSKDRCSGCSHGVDDGNHLAGHIHCDFKKRTMHEESDACAQFEPVESKPTKKHRCGSCSYSHWFSGENTYVNVVQDDGIHTIKRPCEPHTHYCYQFTDGQKKIASDKDFDPEGSPEWCPLKEVISPCETEESRTNSGSASCANGTPETGVMSNADNTTATTAQDSREEESCATCNWNCQGECIATPSTIYGEEITDPEMNTCNFYLTNKASDEEAERVEASWPKPEQKKKPRIGSDRGCQEMREDCPCFCKHNDGCVVLIIQGNALRTNVAMYSKNYTIDCDVFREVAGRVLGKDKDMTINKEETGNKLDVASSTGIDIKPFDYSTVDTDTAGFLQEKANKITEIRIKSVIAIGKELKDAHAKLANHYQGSFGKWCSSIGISRDTAENYMRAFNYVAENFGNIEDAEKIQPSLLFAASKPSAPKELSDQVASGDITSHKQYKELEAKLKAAEGRAQDVIEKTQEEVNRMTEEQGQLIDDLRDKERTLKLRDSELANTMKAYKKDVDDLNQQLTQAKRNSDPEKIKDLGQIIHDKQQEIEKLRQQLHDKPIEVPAVRVVEKTVIPDAIKDSIYKKVVALYDGILQLTQDEIKVFAEAVDPDYFEQVTGSIRRATIRLNVIESEVISAQEDDEDEQHGPSGILKIDPNGRCGSCTFADMDQLPEDQLNDNKTWCTLEDKVVDFDHNCGRFERYGDRP